jgi:hypothetical protein
MGGGGGETPFTGPEPVCSTYGRDIRGTLRNWRSKKHLEHWKLINGIREVKLLILGPLSKTMALLHLNRNQFKSVKGLLMGHCHLKRHLHKMGLVDSSTCNKCLKSNQTVMHMLCYCKALAGLRYHHFGAHLLNPHDFHKVKTTKLLQFIQDTGLLMG